MMRRLFPLLLLTCLLPTYGFAEAPVVDDSENFALFDEPEAGESRPLAKESSRTAYRDEETALANDDEAIATESTSRNNALLLDKIRGLQQEVQELRGQLEIQAHDLTLLQQQQLAFYKDLDTRLRTEPTTLAKKEAPKTQQTSTKTPQSPVLEIPLNTVSAARPNTAHTNPASEQISYLAAYELVQHKQFDEALVAMQRFVAQYPQGGYTANAEYWLGELCLVKKNYPEAIRHFETVLQQFPSSSKSGASMLKIGYALAATGQKNDAIKQLQNVVKHFPDTNTAQLAMTKLESLNS